MLIEENIDQGDQDYQEQSINLPQDFNDEKYQSPLEEFDLNNLQVRNTFTDINEYKLSNGQDQEDNMIEET